MRRTSEHVETPGCREAMTVTETGRPRRPKGTGSLRHLDADRWQITVKVRDKRISRVFTARNQTEANRTADSVRLSLKADRDRVAQTGGAEREQRQAWTVKRYTAYYFEKWAPYNLAATTRQRYRQLCGNQVVPYLGKKRMAEITPADLTRLYSKLAEPGASKREGKPLAGLTIWHVHRFIEAVFTFAVDAEGDFETNPARKTRPSASRESRRPPAIDLAEVERFLALAKKSVPELYPAVMIPAHLGTRRGETLAIRWADIDFERGSVTIRRSVVHTKEEGTTAKSTKTGKVRTIPLDDDTLEQLRSHMRAQRKRRLLYGPGWRGESNPADDYVCATTDGSVLSPDTYSYAFRSFATDNDFTHITPHVLRHAWVSQMIALGWDAVTIASMSGHSPDVLLTTYAHAFDARKREAMNALADARKLARTAE